MSVIYKHKYEDFRGSLTLCLFSKTITIGFLLGPMSSLAMNSWLYLKYKACMHFLFWSRPHQNIKSVATTITFMSPFHQWISITMLKGNLPYCRVIIEFTDASSLSPFRMMLAMGFPYIAFTIWQMIPELVVKVDISLHP